MMQPTGLKAIPAFAMTGSIAESKITYTPHHPALVAGSMDAATSAAWRKKRVSEQF